MVGSTRLDLAEPPVTVFLSMKNTIESSRVLITGASAGIGRATAKLLAQQGYDLVLLARREAELLKLKKEIFADAPGRKVDVFTLDIRQRKQVEAFALANTELISEVEVLINNAGLARGVEKVQEANIQDWEDMIDTNLKGLLYLTRVVVESMVKHKRGYIFNIGSVAGRWVYPGGAVYCATKFAVRALSEGLRLDLMGTPIRVTNIEPGMVDTEFSEVRLQDATLARKVYAGMKPLSADDIAETIAWCLARPAHVNIQELAIFPTDQAGVGYVSRRT